MTAAAETRLTSAVAKRLGLREEAVTFVRWAPSARPGGPESPVFGVPAPLADRAAALGLSSWQLLAWPARCGRCDAHGDWHLATTTIDMLACPVCGRSFLEGT